MAQDSLPLLVGRLLRRNKIEFDKTELSFQIQSHPSYPSLHAITGVLDHFKIDNIAAIVPVEIASIEQMPKTFMAQLDDDLAVISQTSKGLQVQDSSLREDILSISSFLEKFTGVIVAVEATEDTAIIGKPKSGQRALWATAGLFFVALMLISGASLTTLSFLGLSILGVGLSMAILKQEFGLISALGSAFCNNATEKKDCNAVINSDGAKVMGKYKISDLSLVYFVSLALVGTLDVALNKRVDLLYYISILSVPITFYSIYYQWTVLKKWCALCLSIVAVLWLQTTIALLSLDLSFPIQSNSVLLFLFLSILVFTVWGYLRPKQEELKDGYTATVKYTKFKRNFELFSTLLNNGKSYDTDINHPLEIVLGNAEAVTEITIVTNPFCGHCREVHTLTEKILSQYRDNVRLNIRFNISLDNKQSDLVRICTRLLEIYDTQGKDICLMAMSEIYGDSTSTVWLEKWSDSKRAQTYFPLLEIQDKWCLEHSINFTPEILVNGISYPKAYERTDLIYFIEDLNEQASESRQALTNSSAEITV